MNGVLTERVVFAYDELSAVIPWSAVDDIVMGSRSRSRFSVTPAGTGLFDGLVSLADGGGFCSVRSPDFTSGWCGFRGVALRVLGDARTYTLCLHTLALPPGTSYRCQFAPPAGEWAEVSLGFDRFVLTRLGYRVGVEPVNPDHVRSVSLMIADKQEGPFALELARLAVWG